MTQKRLAQAAGINLVYLSQIETGKRSGSLKTLAAIAEALGVETGDLFEGGAAGVSSSGATAPPRHFDRSRPEGSAQRRKLPATGTGFLRCAPAALGSK